MLFGESLNEAIAVLPNSFHEIVGRADIERAVPLAGEHVNIERHVRLSWVPIAL